MSKNYHRHALISVTRSVITYIDSLIRKHITHNDFRPTYIEDNEKKMTRVRNDGKSKCLICAVSLYNSAENAIKMLSFLSAKQDSHFENKLIAIGLLSEEDGLASAANHNGHLSFFEYVNSKIYLKFEAFRHKLK